LAAILGRRGDPAPTLAAARRGFAIDLPRKPRAVEGASGSVKSATFLWAGPDRWLALARPRPTGDWLAAFHGGGLGGPALVDLTGGRGWISIAGPRARDALARLVAVDLDPRVFAPGDVALTALAHMPATLWRPEAGDGFEALFDRSMAGSIWRALEHSCAAFGMDFAREA
ncbi:MAG: hypothetical protein KGQ28_11280, partial [Hyphomicrobiales bacterium]|nr:hypothetical protein [Hyphomicrobiales bacterium]